MVTLFCSWSTASLRMVSLWFQVFNQGASIRDPKSTSTSPRQAPKEGFWFEQRTSSDRRTSSISISKSCNHADASELRREIESQTNATRLGLFIKNANLSHAGEIGVQLRKFKVDVIGTVLIIGLRNALRKFPSNHKFQLRELASAIKTRESPFRVENNCTKSDSDGHSHQLWSTLITGRVYIANRQLLRFFQRRHNNGAEGKYLFGVFPYESRVLRKLKSWTHFPRPFVSGWGSDCSQRDELLIQLQLRF